MDVPNNLLHQGLLLAKNFGSRLIAGDVRGCGPNVVNAGVLHRYALVVRMNVLVRLIRSLTIGQQLPKFERENVFHRWM